MAQDQLRIVLHLTEAGLRSTLVARITLGGADVLTVRELTPYQPSPPSRGALVLVIDEPGVRGYPGSARALYGDPRWWKLIVLTSAHRPDQAPDHLHHLDASGAAASLAALLEKWRFGT